MNNQNNLQTSEPVQSSKNIWIIIISIIITAIIVGGGVYVWQKSEVNNLNAKFIQVQKLLSDQKEEIVDLNTKITQLNNQMLEITTKKDSDVINKSDSWKTYTNKRDGYSIMLPSDFTVDDSLVTHAVIVNYELNDETTDPLYEHKFEDIMIQIDKYNLDIASFFDEYKDFELGNFITESNYIEQGPGGSLISYIAIDKENSVYYDITIFEPGYSRNKEVVKKIVATFKIL